MIYVIVNRTKPNRPIYKTDVLKQIDGTWANMKKDKDLSCYALPYISYKDKPEC